MIIIICYYNFLLLLNDYNYVCLLVQICNVHGNEEHHYSLDLHPEEERHFCAFNAIFSPDNKEVLAAYVT